MSVPDPRKRPGNVACESRRVKPKASLNHPGEPGEGKAGRVNANEPPLIVCLLLFAIKTLDTVWC
jgi:hypothetical protein